MIRFRSVYLVGTLHKQHRVFFNASHQEAHSVGLPIVGNVIPDHLVGMVSSNFLPVKLLLFPLQLISN